MKINEGFMLREVAGNYVVVPVGKASEKFKGVINLNAVGAFLWKKIEEGLSEEEIVEALLSEYDVEKEQAKKDVENFINKLVEAKFASR